MFELELETRVLGRVLERHTTLGSTNDRAKELARCGAMHGLAVIADEQTRGRGQRGKSWSSPAGAGLYISFVLRPQLPPRAAPLLTLLSGLALFDAVERTCGVRAMIKWPNDLLVREGPLYGRKLAGVLVEAVADAEKIDHAVVGIGVNLKRGAWPETLTGYAAALEECAVQKIDRAKLFAALAYELETKLTTAEQQGLATIIERVTDNLAGLNQPATLDLDTTRIMGHLTGIAEDGSLTLQLEDGTHQPFHRGELHLPGCPQRPKQ